MAASSAVLNGHDTGGGGGDLNSSDVQTNEGNDARGTTERAFLIGVAGGTASGKSTVCQRIIAALQQCTNDRSQYQRVEIISQECFYRELNEEESAAAAKGQFNFDHPSAVDAQLMMDTIEKLLAKQTATVPNYDFKYNCRRGSRDIGPADVILFEGILVFFFPKLRELCDVRLFVDLDADTRLAMRVERDVKEHHRPLEQVLSQYMTYVKPAFEEFCLPTKKFADIIIPRGADNKVAIDLIVQHINDLLKNGRPSTAAATASVARSISVHSTDSTVSRPH